jgi:malate dehydrogenase
MSRKRITIVGAGHVGGTTAHLTALKELGDIVLIDVVEGLPQGKALDIYESSPIEGFDVNVIGTNDYKDTSDSDIVVITAGVARKPGMSRDDLLQTNARIVKSVTQEIVKYSKNPIVIVVSNPLDAMVYVASEVGKFPKNRILGMSGTLDSTRLRSFIAMKLGVSVNYVDAFVLGGHGDSMVPLISTATVHGISVSRFMSKRDIDAIIERTRNAGAEIVNLLKTGSAFYAPGSAIVEVIESIIKDKKRILPCSVWLQGEYGAKNIFVGVPVKLGSEGVEGIIELKLSKGENEQFQKTVANVKELVEKAREFIQS